MENPIKNIHRNVTSVRSRLSLVSVIILLLVFFVPAGFGLHAYYSVVNESLQQQLRLISAEKTAEFNDCMESVERAVTVLKEQILDTFDDAKFRTDSQYEQLYMERITYSLSKAAFQTDNVVGVFFRLEPEMYKGNKGVFLTGTRKNGFIPIRLTDLSLYSPTDIEHVGWFYLPVWNGDAMWMPPYENKNINIHMISYVTPIFIDDHLLGVVGMDISMATIKAVVENISLEDTGALLIGEKNNLVYSTDYRLELPPAETISELRRIHTMAQEKNGDMLQFSWNGKPQYGLLTHLRTGMELVVFISKTARLYSARTLFLLLGASLLMVLCLAKILLRRARKDIFTPISELTEASYRLSRGELSIPISYKSNNEFGVLADSIRKMAVQLREYIDFIHDQAESEREAKENALNASKAKSDFLANMSHEIRTPINAMLGMDEMILRETENEAIWQYAVNIKHAGNSLLSIINDVLDFSKIESGKMELLPESYDISTILVDLLTMISERAQSKNLELVQRISRDVPKMLIGDSIRIKQCILNLLTNAVKYTMKGSITFTVTSTRDVAPDGKQGVWLQVIVKDTGIGIKEDDLEKIFAPFERVEEKRNRTIEGTGLGLNIVQRILALMNSKLEVESEYGKGSTFSFKVWQEIAGTEPIGDILEAYRNRIAFIGKYSEKLIAPNAHILFVDDTPINLEVMKGLLKNTKIQLDTAQSGREALEKVQNAAYDILFIDHRMPEMDGIETLEAMKKLEGNKCVDKPCIALTANAVSGAREMYLAAGFIDYLAKPVNPEKLEELIMRYLPAELIETHAEPSSNESDADSAESNEPEEETTKLPEIEGIDANIGVQHCGTADLFIEMLGLVYESLPENTAAITEFFEKEDYENYRIKVHSLKSTARLIGATELSEKAARLESAAAEKDKEFLQTHTTDLLDSYKHLSQLLEPFAPKKTEN